VTCGFVSGVLLERGKDQIGKMASRYSKEKRRCSSGAILFFRFSCGLLETRWCFLVLLESGHEKGKAECILWKFLMRKGGIHLLPRRTAGGLRCGNITALCNPAKKKLHWLGMRRRKLQYGEKAEQTRTKQSSGRIPRMRSSLEREGVKATRHSVSFQAVSWSS